MKESKDPQGDRFVGLTESATKGFMKDVFKLEVVYDFEPDLIVENPVSGCGLHVYHITWSLLSQH